MTISPKMSLISAISDEHPLTPAQLGYFRSRLRTRIHEVILSIYLDEKKKSGTTKADLANRLGKAPEQITRWLAAPGNLRLDTVSDLLLAMKQELTFEAGAIDLTTRTNEFHELASLTPSSAYVAPTSVNITLVRKSFVEDPIYAN